MSARVTGGVVGAVFGVALSWTGMSSPEVIRQALLLENSYLFLMFGSAVLTAFVGLRLLRALRARAPLTGEQVSVPLVIRSVVGAGGRSGGPVLGGR